MENSPLAWREEKRKQVFQTKVFTLDEIESVSPRGDTGVYTVMEAPDWVTVIPIVEIRGNRHFLMVRQWRHGAQGLSLEFPGGVFEKKEEPETAALRELEEETGFTTKNLLKLGEMNPNPAFMSNTIHFFLAPELINLGAQRLDDDEYLAVETIPEEEAIRGMGRPPYIHALMASALMLYLQRGR